MAPSIAPVDSVDPVEHARRELERRLPSVEQLREDARAGRFIDDPEEFLPLSWYRAKRPRAPVPSAPAAPATAEPDGRTPPVPPGGAKGATRARSKPGY
jgi:hypothetical protein